MTQLSDDEKLRILEQRASFTAEGRRKSWEVVAEETHHAKATVLKVNKWFQDLPWKVVEAFPESIQRLRNDYVGHLEAARSAVPAPISASGALLRSIPDEWPEGSLCTTKDTLHGKEAMRWSTGRPQQARDEFGLNLGQPVPLKAIWFLQGRQHQWDHPKRWKMIFSNDRQIIEEVDGEGFIEVERKEPTPVQWIGVVVIEPRLPTDHPPATCWAVNNIELDLGPELL